MKRIEITGDRLIYHTREEMEENENFLMHEDWAAKRRGREQPVQDVYDYMGILGGVSRIIKKHGNTRTGKISALSEILEYYTENCAEAIEPLICQFSNDVDPLLSYAKDGKPEMQTNDKRAILECYSNL